MADDLVERLRGGKCPECDGWGEVYFMGEMVGCTCLGRYERPISMETRTEAADTIGSLRAENARLKRDMANLKANGIHSCHADCQRPLCVAQRENARLTEERDALASVLDGAIKDDRIDEIDKIANYKYFGHYEMSEAQLDATLDAIYALQTIKRMRAALAKVKGGTDAR